MLGSFLGRALGRLGGCPPGCCCSHLWDHCANALLLLSQRWLESFIAALFPCHRLASSWHLLQPVTVMILLFITVMQCSVPGGVTSWLQVFGICSSSLRTGQPGIFETQKPFYLGFDLRHRSPQPVLRYKHLAGKMPAPLYYCFEGEV